MPGLELKERTELLDSDLDATYKVVRSHKDSRFNTLDYRFGGRLAYQYAPRLNFSATALYERDSNPGQEVSQTVILTNLVRRYQQQYSFQSQYAVSRRTFVSAAYSYAQYDYLTVPLQSEIQGSSQSGQQDPPAPPDPSDPPDPPDPPTPPEPPTPLELREVILSSSDVKVHNPSLRLSHSFDELTVGSFDAGYTRFLYKYSTVDNYTVTLGVSRALNELWNLSVNAGGRFTQSEYTPVKRTYLVYPVLYQDSSLPTENEEGFGWVGQVALGYNGERTSGTLSLFRDVSMGRLSANEKNGVILDTSYRFSRDIDSSYGFMKACEVSFGTGYQINRADRGQFGSEAVDDRILQFRVGFRYDFTKDISLNGGFNKIIGDYSFASSNIDQYSANLNLTIKNPMF